MAKKALERVQAALVQEFSDKEEEALKTRVGSPKKGQQASIKTKIAAMKQKVVDSQRNPSPQSQAGSRISSPSARSGSHKSPEPGSRITRAATAHSRPKKSPEQIQQNQRKYDAKVQHSDMKQSEGKSRTETAQMADSRRRSPGQPKTLSTPSVKQTASQNRQTLAKEREDMEKLLQALSKACYACIKAPNLKGIRDVNLWLQRIIDDDPRSGKSAGIGGSTLGRNVSREVPTSSEVPPQKPQRPTPTASTKNLVPKNQITYDPPLPALQVNGDGTCKRRTSPGRRTPGTGKTEARSEAGPRETGSEQARPGSRPRSQPGKTQAVVRAREETEKLLETLLSSCRPSTKATLKEVQLVNSWLRGFVLEDEAENSAAVECKVPSQNLLGSGTSIAPSFQEKPKAQVKPKVKPKAKTKAQAKKTAQSFTMTYDAPEPAIVIPISLGQLQEPTKFNERREVSPCSTPQSFVANPRHGPLAQFAVRSVSEPHSTVYQTSPTYPGWIQPAHSPVQQLSRAASVHALRVPMTVR